MKTSLVLGVALFIFASCTTLPPTEPRLIGTWAISGAIDHHQDGSQTRVSLEPTMDITVTPDHRMIWRDRSGKGEAVARWRLEGNDLVFTMETKSFWGGPGTTRRERIVKITSNELIVGDGTTDGVWTRIR